jgi:hypothetical protein
MQTIQAPHVYERVTQHEIDQVSRKAYAAGYRDGWMGRIEVEQAEAAQQQQQGRQAGTDTGHRQADTQTQTTRTGQKARQARQNNKT